MKGFEITINGEKNMLYILIITCIYTRAVNLLLCRGVDNKAFISALQIHVFEFGIPQRIISDQGSSFVSSINHIKNFLNDTEVKNFLTLNNIKSLDFSPYPAKASFLGGMVESLVKQTKNIVYSSIGKNVLEYNQFYLLIKETNMLINKRSIAFKNLLSNNTTNNVTIPYALTPEILIKGFEVPCVVVALHLYYNENEQMILIGGITRKRMIRINYLKVLKNI